MAINKLQPCPFCGARPSENPEEPVSGCWVIRCWTCCTYGPVGKDGAEAAGEWNRRHASVFWEASDDELALAVQKMGPDQRARLLDAIEAVRDEEEDDG